MTISLLTYAASQLGDIHHWLVAGPAVLPPVEPDELAGETARSSGQLLAPVAGVSLPVVDLGPLAAEQPKLTWRYYRCQEDHWIDLTAFHPNPVRLQSWAYTLVDSPVGGPANVVLAVEGSSLNVWLNGSPVITRGVPARVGIETSRISVNLQPGKNEVLIRFDADGQRETAYRLAMRIEGVADHALQILLPTAIEPERVDLRQRLETVSEAAYLDRYVYGYPEGDHYHKNEPINVHYSASLTERGELTHRLQSLSGDIFQESTRNCEAEFAFELAGAFPLRGGPHHLAILPPAKDYYIHKLQVERKDLFFVVRSDYASQPSGAPAERAKQALEHAAQRRSESLYCELAKMSLGWWDKLNAKAMQIAVERIQGRQDGSVNDLLAILGMLLRFKKDFALLELKTRFEASVVGYRYWSDQPGEDGMNFCAESRQILVHTCEILAGQMLPRTVFANSGRTGKWHRQHGETMALAWMRQRGAYGFREWDSPASVEMVLAALAHLVELAASAQIREMAAILMDKVLFSLALNSWQGIYGASRGYADTPGVLSARLAPTSGIGRLLWGMGNFNEAILGTVSLALCSTYQLPAPIEKIATDGERVGWTRERSSQPGTSWEVNRVTYRTPDFMLSSAQDYAPGQPGAREHIWQATLGPDAIVYTNHPANLNVETGESPNLWAGSGVLPRVVQWGDVLVALYHLPPEDWLGFTHAYFPASAFDEYRVGAHWAFARKGKAYLALYAAKGLHWMQGGKTALRELRSYGPENIWICHMGQEMLDGSYATFQEKILAMEMMVGPSHLALTSLRDDRLEVGWEGPLRVNGGVQATAGFKQYESPYCTVDLPAVQMDIVYQGEGVRLKFA